MNFLGIGPMELILILILALIIFGPGRLPEIGAALGKSIREFRQASLGLVKELEEATKEPEKEPSDEEGAPEEPSDEEGAPEEPSCEG